MAHVALEVRWPEGTRGLEKKELRGLNHPQKRAGNRPRSLAELYLAKASIRTIVVEEKSSVGCADGWVASERADGRTCLAWPDTVDMPHDPCPSSVPASSLARNATEADAGVMKTRIATHFGSTHLELERESHDREGKVQSTRESVPTIARRDATWKASQR